MANINLKGPFGRQYWEDKAENAWSELGKPKADPAPKNPTKNDLEYDAFRHAFISALWARISVDGAKAGGDHVELGNPNNFKTEKGQRDMRGDLINNEKGREIGDSSPRNQTEREIAERVVDLIKKGDLVLDKQSDPRTLKENFPDNLQPKDWRELLPDKIDKIKQEINDWINERSTNRKWEDFDEFPFPYNINDDVNDDFNDARKAQAPRRDPLTLDLDGDGLETVGSADPLAVMFDHDNDGIKTKSGWVKPDDGLLVLDHNGNGLIDNGSELFGDATRKQDGTLAKDGFDALADMDSNGDGKVDAQDNQFANLRVWRDLNSDGISQANELQTLSAAGIQSFTATKTANSQVLTNGNRIADLGNFTRTDGTSAIMGDVTGDMADVDLAENAFYRTFTVSIAITEELKGLPSMQGAGAVRDLKEAASLSPDLATTLAAYAAASTRAEQKILLEKLLSAWAQSADFIGSQKDAEERGLNAVFTFAGDSSGVQSLRMGGGGSGGGGMVAPGDTHYSAYAQSWLNKLAILEAFNGSRFVDFSVGANNGGTELRMGKTSGSGGGSGGMVLPGMEYFEVVINQNQLNFLDQAWNALCDSVYGNLAIQTRLKPYLDSVNFVFDESGVKFDTSALTSMIKDGMNSSPQKTLTDLAELVVYANSTFKDVGFDAPVLLSKYMSDPAWSSVTENVVKDVLAGFKQNYWSGTGGNDFAVGDSGNNTLYGNAGDDLLMGGAGNDTLDGGVGNDTLDGGAGADTLTGGVGNDTYLLGRSSGSDTISESDSTAGNTDVAKFLDVASTDVTAVERKGEHLILTYGTADQLIVNNYFSGSTYRIEQFQFSDGVTWDDVAIKARTMANGDANANSISGYNEGSNRIYGMAGNDYLYGGVMADTIDGGADNDYLAGYAGDDLLLGGTGNDTLDGGVGNDTLDGGAGADTLTGGVGNDTYLLGRSSGSDTISESDSTAGNTDVAQFGAGISNDQLWFRHVGNNLEVSVIGTSDKFTIQNWYSGSQYHVEQFKTADGQMLLDTQVDALVSAMAAFTPPAAGQTSLSQAMHDQLQPVLAANWH